MASSILTIDEHFDFEKLTLVKPNSIGAGLYFCKLLYNKQPFILQAPECKTKNGIVSTTKKEYIDVLYQNSSVILLEWFEQFQKKIIELLYNDKKNLFEDDIEKDDIETLFMPLLKLYKGGKFYTFRANILSNSYLENSVFKYYDEDLLECNTGTITSETRLIPLLEFKGIKISSKNFALEIELKQLMKVESDNNLFNQCLIKPNNLANNLKLNVSQESTPKIDETTRDEQVIAAPEPQVEKPEEESEVVAEPEVVKKENIVNVEKKHMEGEATTEPDVVDSEKKHMEGEAAPEPEVVNTEENEVIEQMTPSEPDVVKHEEENVAAPESDDSSLKEKVNLSPLEESNFNLLEETDDESGEDNMIDELSEDETSEDEEDELDGIVNLEDNLREKKINYENLDSNENKEYNLKARNEIYYNLWKDARDKVKEARDSAIKAYLDAKDIKSTFMLDDLYEPSEFEEYLEKVTTNT